MLVVWEQKKAKGGKLSLIVDTLVLLLRSYSRAFFTYLGVKSVHLLDYIP